jgi:hypothetical protein
MHEIPSTWEVELRRIAKISARHNFNQQGRHNGVCLWSQLSRNLSRKIVIFQTNLWKKISVLTWKITKAIRGGSVAKVIECLPKKCDSEFKSQHHLQSISVSVSESVSVCLCLAIYLYQPYQSIIRANMNISHRIKIMCDSMEYWDNWALD